MPFADLAKFLPRIEREIASGYARGRRSVEPAFRPYVDALAEFTLRGGKRFRALLVLAGFRLVADRDPGPALSAAAAFEHFQSWMLIHDDIIDHSERRRNGPTLHRIFESEFRARSGIGRAEEYGTGLGITVGDLAEPQTVEALLRCPVPAPRRLTALAEYVRMTRETAFGQALDIRNGTLPVEGVQESDVLLVHRCKTARYTVASPLRVGAMLAGGSRSLLADLEAVGLDYGIAFQLRDDVLGTGLGPPAGDKSANDLAEGKRTLLVVRAWASADPAQRELLARALGNPGATPAMFDEAREVIRTTGSLAHSEGEIARLQRRADRRVKRSRALSRRGKALLLEIGEKLVHRSA